MKNLIRFTLTASLSLTVVLAEGHSCSEMENFLLTARTGISKSLSTGVTGTHKVSLDDGTLQHAAHLQTVDEKKTTFEGSNGNAELNFRDSYKYNIAAYELAKMLELNMVPPYVERSVGQGKGSLAWWIDNAMMESERFKKNIAIPDPEEWNKQMYAVRVFHELVYDTDPNLTNLLITKDWQLWMIDLTRGFRLHPALRQPKNLVQIDRRLLEHLRSLDENTLKAKLGHWLTNGEIHALDARRAKIVRLFDEEVKAKGESAVLYEFSRSNQACGTGL